MLHEGARGDVWKNIARYERISCNNYGSMAEVIIKAALLSIKKEYRAVRAARCWKMPGKLCSRSRRLQAMPVVFLMDRFGYVRTID